MYRCVIFDLDGTVLNTLEDLADAGNYALARLGFPTHPVENYRFYVGNGIPKLIERILPENTGRKKFDECHKLFCSYYSGNMNNKTAPYEGIPETLALLRRLGLKLALVSNKSHEFTVKLVKKAFGEAFDVIYGSVPDKPRKPDPYWVNLVLERLCVSHDDAFYVGDSGVDMMTAKNAGITACGVLWGFRDRGELMENGADFICGDCRELVKLITS